MATSDEEQAVSRVTAGPSSPSVYATLPEAMLPVWEVPMKPSRSAGTDSMSGA